MATVYEFFPKEIERAFDRADGHCDCCGKELAWQNSRTGRGRGAHEAHHGSRETPVILCIHCRLECGHAGHRGTPGITPRFCRVR
jgi:hypothetical protein